MNIRKLLIAAGFLAVLVASHAPAKAEGHTAVPSIMGTVALPGASVFNPLDVRQRRAIMCPAPAAAQIASRLRGGGRMAEIKRVEAWVEGSIRPIGAGYLDANKVLKYRAGNAFDRAFTKMQILYALGFERGQVYMMMANGRYFVTVYLGGVFEPLPAPSQRFVPILSLRATYSNFDCTAMGSSTLQPLVLDTYLHGFRQTTRVSAASDGR